MESKHSHSAIDVVDAYVYVDEPERKGARGRLRVVIRAAGRRTRGKADATCWKYVRVLFDNV